MIMPNIWENKIDVPNHQPVETYQDLVVSLQSASVAAAPSSVPRSLDTKAWNLWLIPKSEQASQMMIQSHEIPLKSH